jgi:hypothetical protein
VGIIAPLVAKTWWGKKVCGFAEKILYAPELSGIIEKKGGF